MHTAAVIGGGASGLMAAITAAENNCKVTLFERQQRVGRKLLSTGNGRCNISNTGACPESYRGVESCPDFVRPALESFGPADTLAFFRSLGLLTVEQYGGRVYPVSDSANSVVDVLRLTADAMGIETVSSSPVASVTRSKEGFRLCLSDGTEYTAKKLIIACGGIAGGKLGGVPDGYELLKSFGHSRTALYPSLCPISCDSPYPRSLKGVRAECRVSLFSGGKLLAESSGELQFTENGVSGPAAFDLSRAAAIAGKGTVCADFLPELPENELFGLLQNRVCSMPELPASDILTGILHNRLGRMVVKYAGVDAALPVSCLSDKQLRSVVRACRRFELPFKGVGGFDQAQVTAGGIRCREFNPETLESLKVPGLYACGEVLDVDAPCGGYNLQWAWSSGRLAGLSAGK